MGLGTCTGMRKAHAHVCAQSVGSGVRRSLPRSCIDPGQVRWSRQEAWERLSAIIDETRNLGEAWPKLGEEVRGRADHLHLTEEGGGGFGGGLVRPLPVLIPLQDLLPDQVVERGTSWRNLTASSCARLSSVTLLATIKAASGGASPPRGKIWLRYHWEEPSGAKTSTSYSSVSPVANTERRAASRILTDSGATNAVECVPTTSRGRSPARHG